MAGTIEGEGFSVDSAGGGVAPDLAAVPHLDAEGRASAPRLPSDRRPDLVVRVDACGRVTEMPLATNTRRPSEWRAIRVIGPDGQKWNFLR